MWRGLISQGYFACGKNSMSFARSISSSLLTMQFFMVRRTCSYGQRIHGARWLYEQKPKDGFAQRSFKMHPLYFLQVFIIGLPTQALSWPATVTWFLFFRQSIWLPSQAHLSIQWIATVVLGNHHGCSSDNEATACHKELCWAWLSAAAHKAYKY